MDFNPWRFGEEDELLRSFFESLAGAVGRSLKDPRDFVNTWKDAFSAVPYVGTAAEKLVGKLTARTLEEFKAKTEGILEKEGKRIAVLMDDIDRLETKEIQTVFRLIKLTASINHVAYVLAFDDKVVAAALQEKYGTVSQSGRGFLEKIIQVPLHLPRIPTEVLHRFCCSSVEESLKAVGVNLTDDEQKTFYSCLALLRRKYRLLANVSAMPMEWRSHSEY
jgi:predicted KAP-like P-loop ATPase